MFLDCNFKTNIYCAFKSLKAENIVITHWLIDVIFGYPPDLAHDLFEGIIPVELARLTHFKKTLHNSWSEHCYFDFVSLQMGRQDKQTSVGGNAH